MNTLDENAAVVIDLYYPERFPALCDVTLCYLNTRFHLHSLMLAYESVYFQTIYENGVNQENRELVLPTLHNPIKETSIKEVHMKQFFECLYARGQFNFDDIVGNNNKFAELPLIHLSHYFQVECILSRLKEVNQKWLNVSNKDLFTNGWYALCVYQTYQWTDLFNHLKQHIEKHIEVFMREKGNRYFTMLKEETKIDLERKYICRKSADVLKQLNQKAES